MRIVAGKYRRRKLRTNPGLVTRPITDRAKELLFENLGGELPPLRVADVFAGTGTLGLEALSRGAASVVFIESDRKAHALLEENVRMLGIEDEALCWRADVFRCSFRPKGVESLLPYDLVFFDPPYRMVPDIAPGSPLYKSLERLAREGVTSPGAELILRTPIRTEFELPPQWVRHDALGISNMEMHRFRKGPGGTP
ncbi:MAG: RsmD family RNA methyltransferase [Planctomycetales bacterium]